MIHIEVPSDSVEYPVVDDVKAPTPSSSEPSQLQVTNDIQHVQAPPVPRARKKAKREILQDNPRKLNFELQITMNLFIVVCAFLLCQTPYFSVFLLNVKGAPVLYAALGVFSNSAINPMIYAVKHPHFRKVFKCILFCMFNEVPERADFIKSIDLLSRGY